MDAPGEGRPAGLFNKLRSIGTQIKQALKRDDKSVVFLSENLAFAHAASVEEAAALADQLQQARPRTTRAVQLQPLWCSSVQLPVSRGSVVLLREDFLINNEERQSPSFLDSTLSFVRSALNWIKADATTNVFVIVHVASEAPHEALVGLHYALLAMCLVFSGSCVDGQRALELVLGRVASVPVERAAGPSRTAPSPGPSAAEASPSNLTRAAPTPSVSNSLRRYVAFFTELFRSETQPVVEGPDHGPLLTGPQAFLASIASRRLRLEKIELRFSNPPYLDALLRHRIEGQNAAKFWCIHVHTNRGRPPRFTSAPWDVVRECHCMSGGWAAPVQEARVAGDASSGTVLRLGEGGDGVDLEGDCLIDVCHACTPTESAPGYCHRLFRVALHPAFVLPCGAARLRRSQVDVPAGLASTPLLQSVISPASSASHADALALQRPGPSASPTAGPSSPAPGCPFCAQFKASSFYVDLVFGPSPAPAPAPDVGVGVAGLSPGPQAAGLFAARLDEAARGFCDVRWLDGGPVEGPAPDDPPAPAPSPLSAASPSPTPPPGGSSPANVSRRLPFSLPFFGRDRDGGQAAGDGAEEGRGSHREGRRSGSGRHRHRTRAAEEAAGGEEQLAADEALARQLQDQEEREARRALRRRVAQVRAAADAAAAGSPTGESSLAAAAAALLGARSTLAGGAASSLLAARLAQIAGRPRGRWLPAPPEGEAGEGREGGAGEEEDDYPTFQQERLRDMALHARQLEQMLAHVGYDVERLSARQLEDVIRRIDRLNHGQAGGYEENVIRSLPTYLYRPPAGPAASVPAGATEEEAAVAAEVAAAAAAADAAEREGAGGAEEGAARECSVCLSEWKEGDKLKILPCIHQFHAKCIDRWLQINLTCPACNQKVDELPEMMR